LLLERLTQLSGQIAGNERSPEVWRYQVAQADVMLQLAVRSQGKERDNWLRSAVDGYFSAAVQCPDKENTPRERLAQLAREIGQVYPGCPVASYAILQGVQADSMRALSQPNADPKKVQGEYRDRLVRFAQDHPGVPEATQAILEAGHISESLGKPDDARRCYRYLSERYPENPLARKARGAMWRLGMAGEPVRLELPYLYPTSGIPDQKFDSEELRGKLVLFYFWSSSSPRASEDFQLLKRLTDRYQEHGLEVVYVNLDKEQTQAHAFLSGRLLAGTHVYDRGGLESPIADRYGIQSLPQVILVDRDGTLIQHSIPTARLEEVLSARMPRVR
jgi:hypothetical protein